MATFHANSGIQPHEPMFGVQFKKLNKLKRFGEIVLVTTKKKIQGKLSDRSTV
jgi:hypothetical protein